MDNGTSTGALSTMTSSNNSITWTGTFTPTDDIEDNTSVLTLGTSYTDLAGNTGPTEQTANYEVDTREPIVDTIAITAQSGKQNNFLNPNDNVSFTVSFSETVIVDNSSGLSLTYLMGSENRSAQYTSGSGNAQQVFGYTIDDLLTSGENDSNGLSTGSDPIVLPGGSTIKDLAGNSAIITHAGMSTNSAYKVDTIPPTVDSTAITGENGIQNYFLNLQINHSYIFQKNQLNFSYIYQ